MHKAAGEDVFYEMEEALIKRILPHSIEAEQSVIGSMILDRDAILVASEILTSDDFYQSQYGIIFDAMVELCNEGKPVDLITLQNRLKEKELPPDISSMEYVRDLISAVPTSANVKYYANIVSEKAVLRRLIKVNEEVENACYMEKEGTQMILEEAEKKLFNVLQRRSSDEFVPIQQVVLNAVNNIEKASKMKGTVTGIPTGFVDLDYKTSGMHASDLVLIAARPSMGKTAFVLNIAQYMAFRKDVTVAIFSLEMSKEQLVNRLLAMESHVDSQNLRTGNLKDEDWTKLVEGADIIGRSNLIIDEDARTTLAFVETFPDGDRDFSFYRNPGADMMLRKEDLHEDLIRDAKIFHYGTLSMTHDGVREATKKAIDIAKESGAIISFDPNLRPPLWKTLDDAKEQVAYGLSKCDVLKISDNEIQWFTGEEDFDAGIAKLREQYNIPLIMLSLGRDGSRAYYKDLRVEVKPFLQDSTIETTGAGDTFGGCCLHYVLKYGLDNLDEEKLTEMLTFANAAASIVTTRKGALRVMPEVEEVEAFIKSRA